MEVESQAGNFKMTVDSMRIEEDKLVMVGTMGVWNSHTYFTTEELTQMTLMAFRPKILLFFMLLPIRAIIYAFKRKKD